MSTDLQEQLKLMGIRHVPYGVPTTLVPSKVVRDLSLMESSLSLFKGVKEMRAGLDRAHRIVSRVNATINSQRQSSRTGAVNEKSRAEAMRLDQEIATAMDALRTASETLEALDAAQRAAQKEERQRRRQGR